MLSNIKPCGHSKQKSVSLTTIKSPSIPGTPSLPGSPSSPFFPSRPFTPAGPGSPNPHPQSDRKYEQQL